MRMSGQPIRLKKGVRRRIVIGGRRRLLRRRLGDRHQRRAQHALAQHVAGLDHLRHASRRGVTVRRFVHRLVRVRCRTSRLAARTCARRCAQGRSSNSRSVNATPSSSAFTFQCADSRRVFRADRGQGPVHVVGHRQHVAGKTGDGVLPGVGDFAFGALAQVFHLGKRAQQLVLELGGLALGFQLPGILSSAAWPVSAPCASGARPSVGSRRRCRARCCTVGSFIAGLSVACEEVRCPGYQGCAGKNQAWILRSASSRLTTRAVYRPWG